MMKNPIVMKPLPSRQDPKVSRIVGYLSARDLKPVPTADWPEAHEYAAQAVWCNKHFLVIEGLTQESKTLGTLRHLCVRPHDGLHPGWGALQTIKNDLIGRESWAMEVFPPEFQLVDDANMYHLWIITDPAFIPRMEL